MKVVIQELELGDKSIEISQPWYSKYALANMPAYQTLTCCLFSFPKVSKYNFFYSHGQYKMLTFTVQRTDLSYYTFLK